MRKLYIILFCTGLVKIYALNDLSFINKEDSINKSIWGQLGFHSDGEDRLGFQLGLNFGLNKHIFSLRYYQNNDKGFVPFQSKKTNYIQEMKNLSLLYGYSFHNEYFRFIPMVGLSVGKGNWRNNHVDTIAIKQSGWGSIITNHEYHYHYDPFQYLGAHVNLNLTWTPTKYFGVGVDIFANFHNHPDKGIVFSLFFGQVRSKS
ncbi:MAG: hypothetical protein KF900_06435 [Bacteroidetes bacterium]|nr:hypothetical protein [Bacteroidota bacterium]